ncbi:hypothetical protein HDU98_003530 [Podochytrium sp. JEL0797]|nr:hypothetical protein HDU98_003530 [Podochytrium sp. JEL0797]
MEDDGFTLIKRKGRRRPARNPPTLPKASDASNFAYKPTSNSSPATSPDDVVAAVRQIMTTMSTSRFFSTALTTFETSAYPLRGPTLMSCICYGLGSPRDSAISRHQLAFLLLLHDQFSFVQVEAYDPVFDEFDVDVLKRVGVDVLPGNEKGCKKVERPTVFYMPHCGAGLYSNVIGANWGKVQLEENVVVIGNSFAAYLVAPDQAALGARAPYLCRVVGRGEEVELGKGGAEYERGDVFNNTCFHSFVGMREVEEEGFWDVGQDVPEEGGDPELV